MLIDNRTFLELRAKIDYFVKNYEGVKVFFSTDSKDCLDFTYKSECFITTIKGNKKIYGYFDGDYFEIKNKEFYES